jgi:hypothetical protein
VDAVTAWFLSTRLWRFMAWAVTGAAALAADGGPQSLRTGEVLIAILDAGCRKP